MSPLPDPLSRTRRLVTRFFVFVRKRGIRRTIQRLLDESGDLLSRCFRGRSRYERWFDARQEESARRFDRGDPAEPPISVVMPVCDPEIRWLRIAIDSVRAQRHRNWELCIVDDASTDPSVWPTLERLAEEESRIRVRRNSERAGIATTTNRAIELATGDYVALLDHDDELTPDALALVAREARETPFDLLYTDEDKIDQRGRLRDPTFKPDRSRELLHTCMYFGHLSVYRRDFLRSLGGFDPEFDGSQDYDLALRAEARADRVVHIPAVLYHWRMAEGSAANPDQDAKPWAYEAGRRAIQAHVARHGEGVRVSDGVGRGHTRIRRDAVAGTTISLLHCPCCLEGDPADGRGLDAGSRPASVPIEWIAMRPGRDGRATSIAQRWNDAAAKAQGDVLVFVEGVRPVCEKGLRSWGLELAGQAMRDGVGAVGGRVRSAGDALLHMGVVLGGPEVVRTRPPALRSDEPGHLALAQSLREVSAVTGGCFAIRRGRFEELGGFDAGYASSLHDVDLCLRIRARGWDVLYDPYVECELVERHFGRPARTRKALPPPSDRDLQRLSRSWRAELDAPDPYSNPNFHARGAIFDPPHRNPRRS